YAPPEQEWRYRPTGPDSDVYALAVTLQTLLAGPSARGVAPERGKWQERTASDLLAEIPNPDKRREAAELAEVLAYGMRYDRSRRYQSASEFGRALAKVAVDRGWMLTASFRTCPYCGHQAAYRANFC